MSKSDHTFARVPSAEIQRSSFDRSCGVKTTFDAGLLIPIFVDEVLPGDTFNLQMTGFARLATPLFPLMDNAYLESFWFFVPNRLLWDNWERFNGAQDDPEDTTDYTLPVETISGLGVQTGSILDYMGCPLGAAEVSALPSRAYYLIWNEWFRDQNLQNSIPIAKDDGPDPDFSSVPLRRGKRHDYFTSCLPWAQKGDAVSIALGGIVPVTPITSASPIPTFDPGDANMSPLQGGGGSAAVIWDHSVAGGPFPAVWDDPALEVNLGSAASATINAIRQAMQMQRLLERDARGGTRYTEILRSHFGVVSPDQRLQRPEFLGSGSSPLIVSQVPQTSASSGSNPLGKLAAYGTVTARNHGFTQSFVEHGLVIGLVCVRADLTYQQGLERFWSRQTRYDFYWPALSHLGEQAVLNKEIYYTNTSVDDEVFGYQERYGEYRYKPSRLTGLMRSDASGTLDAWHLAQNFTTTPELDSGFIQENPPFDRVIAVTTEPHFIADFHFALRCARPMPVYGVPGLIDHF